MFEDWEPPYDWNQGIIYSWASISPRQIVIYWLRKPVMGEGDWIYSKGGYLSIPPLLHKIEIPKLYDWKFSLRHRPEEEFYV